MEESRGLAAFMAQLTDAELVQWDVLLESGLSEHMAQRVLRPSVLLFECDGRRGYGRPRVASRTLRLLPVPEGLWRGEAYVLDVGTLIECQELLLGRAQSMNDVSFRDGSIHKNHCRLRWENNIFIVQDLQTTNGTYLNGRKIAKYGMKFGDTLFLGDQRIKSFEFQPFAAF